MSGRNDPCPCGSGRKYKKCHLASEEATRAAEQSGVKSPLHDLDNGLVEKILPFITSRFPDDPPPAHQVPWFSLEYGFPFLMTWLAYVAPVRGRAPVDWFIEWRGWSLTPGEREWLEAQKRAWLSAWEVIEVREGSGLLLRDLLTGTERFVHEVTASRSATTRVVILARVADIAGVSLLASMHPQPLPPRNADEVIQAMSGIVGSKRPVPIEALRIYKTALSLVTEWEEAIERLTAWQPKFENEDGDAILLTTDRFHFDPEQRDKVESRIRRIAGMTSGNEPGVYALMPGRKKTKTVVAMVRIGDGQLLLETNSEQRAYLMTALLYEKCGDLIRGGFSTHEDPLSEARDRELEPVRDRESTPESAEIVREYKNQYYREWLSIRVPYLDDKTPRQAARSKAGRERLTVLLRDMEYRESRLPEPERFDVGELRKALKLDE